MAQHSYQCMHEAYCGRARVEPGQTSRDGKGQMATPLWLHRLHHPKLPACSNCAAQHSACVESDELGMS